VVAARSPSVGPPTRARALAGAGAPPGGPAVSAQTQRRDGAGEAVGGLLASLSIFTSLIAVAYRPGRLIPGALLLALLATGIGGRHARLASWAIGVGAVCFALGMAVAVLTNNPLY
jgi:hypothetical protein